jgi:nitroreductase
VILDLQRVLRSTGAVREFVDESIGDDVVYRLLEVARFAPSGGNRQGWRVIVVRDRGTRRRLRELYLDGWYEYLAQAAAGLCPWAPITDEVAEAEALSNADEMRAAAGASGGAFAEHLDETPILMVLLADLRRLAAVDRGFERYTLVGGASIYPFAWNLLLAARAEGLGGVMTTVATRREPEVKALLGVPNEFAVAAVVALGKPSRQPTRLRRNPVEEFATVDRYDGPPLEQRAPEEAG